MQISDLESKVTTFLRLVKQPRKTIYPLAQNGFLSWMPDKPFLKLLYWAELEQRLDLKNPQTFSEKIQWLKIYDRNPEYTKMADKILVKEVIAAKIGKEYVIPTYGVWNNAKEIDFDSLPNSFVLKCNNDSGGIVICRDKTKLDKTQTVQRLEARRKRNAYYSSREWQYKNIKRKILAEPLLVDPDNNDLIDYKIFCFAGKPHCCQVIKNRSTDETIDFYDTEWKRMPYTGLGQGQGPKRGGFTDRPIAYEKMLELAERLAQGTIFVRVDFYNIQGRLYFGEFTLYPKSGLGKFFPDEWNKAMGDLIKIDVRG